ncbi:MAG: hypothetical protein AABX52_00765 [Nanoarchaeota archaeon]
MKKKCILDLRTVFMPNARKLRCFSWVTCFSIVVAAFELKGVDVWILVWGWILLWPMLLLTTSVGGLSQENLFSVGLLGLLLLVIYWYIIACMLIVLKDYIES